MLDEKEYTPTMRKMMNIVNDGQGESPYDLVGIERDGNGFKMVFAPNPKYSGEFD